VHARAHTRRLARVFVVTDDARLYEAVREIIRPDLTGPRWRLRQVGRTDQLPDAVSLADWIITDAAHITRALPKWTGLLARLPAQHVLLVDGPDQVACARALGIARYVHKAKLQSELPRLMALQGGSGGKPMLPDQARLESAGPAQGPIATQEPHPPAAPIPAERAAELLALARRLFCLNRQQMHEVCRDAVPRLFGATVASLYEYDAASQTLSLLWHTHDRPIDNRVPLDGGSESPMVQAARERRIWIVPDWNRLERNRQPSVDRPNRRHYRTHTSILAPILLGAELLGVLNLADPDPSGQTGAPARFEPQTDLPLAENVCALLAAAWNHLRMYEQLEQEARTDALTGLANYRTFIQQLTREVMRSRRYGSPLSLIMLDVDGLKQINDTAGHQAGDLALQTVADRIANGVRDIDVPARYGGDEFAVILPNTDLASARQVADRLVRRIHRSPARWQGQPLRTSVSIGVGQYANQLTVEEFIRGIDLALYDAKAAGKNRVAVLQPS